MAKITRISKTIVAPRMDTKKTHIQKQFELCAQYMITILGSIVKQAGRPLSHFNEHKNLYFDRVIRIFTRYSYKL